MSPVETTFELPLFRRGKVRDTYDLGDTLLMVASDRISAFDVVLPTPIPGKGAVLSKLSCYWFKRTRHLVPNHFVSSDVSQFPRSIQPIDVGLGERAMIVRKATRIDVECVVRGYLAGSAWADYASSGSVAGHRLPSQLRKGSRLPSPIFTPAVKHDDGHDMAIAVGELSRLVGATLAGRLEEASRQLYRFAASHALTRGIIVADTKFEFGLIGDELTLIDEAVTPDSSRFWEAARWRPGIEQPSFDKQYVRDWLEQSGWDKHHPAPSLPPDVVSGTSQRYREAYERLKGESMSKGEQNGRI